MRVPALPIILASASLGLLLVLLAAPGWSQQVYVYPQKGQTPEQQAKDQGECQVWAQQQTGFDPMAGPAVASSAPPQQGGLLRGAARGAALGAVGGAIAGDAGEGAAIGAATGGLLGGMRRRDATRNQQHAQDQQVAQYEARRQEFLRAYGACLGGRGYTVN